MTFLVRACALAVAAATLGSIAAACGGDDTGSDGDYVNAFCDARRQFSTDLDAAVKEVSASGGSGFDKIADVFAELADDFEDMKPPKDLKDWHEATSKQLSETADTIKKQKNLQAVTTLGSDPLAQMPDEPRERLEKEAENYDSCKGLNAFAG